VNEHERTWQIEMGDTAQRVQGCRSYQSQARTVKSNYRLLGLLPWPSFGDFQKLIKELFNSNNKKNILKKNLDNKHQFLKMIIVIMGVSLYAN